MISADAIASEPIASAPVPLVEAIFHKADLLVGDDVVTRIDATDTAVTRLEVSDFTR